MTLDLSLLPDGGVGWLDASGDHSDIVLSTRIRLARNVEGLRVHRRGRAMASGCACWPRCARRCGTCRALRGQCVAARRRAGARRTALLLHERHLVSKELAGLDPQHPVRSGAAVFLGDGLGVMINEEDHLRLQALRSGFA